MVSNTSNAANVATAVPIRTSTVMALLSSKPNSHGVAMSHSPATKLSHSSQTAKAASAAIDSTAIKSPMIDAICRGAPAERLNSQGEKNRIVPKSRFTTSQSLALDQSSIIHLFLLTQPLGDCVQNQHADKHGRHCEAEN